VDLVECRQCGHEQREHSEGGCQAQDVDLSSMAPAPCRCSGFSTLSGALADAPFLALEEELGPLPFGEIRL
jgi:hypothetical protein